MITSTATIESDGSFAFKSRLRRRSAGGRVQDTNRGWLGHGWQGMPESRKAAFRSPTSSSMRMLPELTATVTSDEAKNNFELKLNPTKSETGAGDRRGDR